MLGDGGCLTLIVQITTIDLRSEVAQMVEPLLGREGVASSNLVFRSKGGPKWRNRQTRQSQKLLEGLWIP